MFTCVNEPILQCGDTRLFLVWKLHRCLSFHPVGRHEMQLSASQSDFPGTSSFYFLNISLHYIYFIFSFLLFLFLLGGSGHKQGAQQVARLHCGHQDTQPTCWQRTRHVPCGGNPSGYQQLSIDIIYPAGVIIQCLVYQEKTTSFLFSLPISFDHA